MAQNDTLDDYKVANEYLKPILDRSKTQTQGATNSASPVPPPSPPSNTTTPPTHQSHSPRQSRIGGTGGGGNKNSGGGGGSSGSKKLSSSPNFRLLVLLVALVGSLVFHWTSKKSDQTQQEKEVAYKSTPQGSRETLARLQVEKEYAKAEVVKQEAKKAKAENQQIIIIPPNGAVRSQSVTTPSPVRSEVSPVCNSRTGPGDRGEYFLSRENGAKCITLINDLNNPWAIKPVLGTDTPIVSVQGGAFMVFAPGTSPLLSCKSYKTADRCQSWMDKHLVRGERDKYWSYYSVPPGEHITINVQ